MKHGRESLDFTEYSTLEPTDGKRKEFSIKKLVSSFSLSFKAKR